MPQPLLTFIHISDTHIHTDPNYIRTGADIPSNIGAQALVRELNALPFEPDFVLHTGDVAYDPLPGVYEISGDILNDIPYPVHYLAGNHDNSADMQRTLLGRQMVQEPLHGEFEVNGVQVVLVDSNGPAELPAGTVTDSQLAWLAEICAADDDRPLVIATHHNPTPVDIPWLDDYMGIQNGQDFHKAILPARDRLRGVFFGHVHQNIDIYRDGILYASTLSSWVQFQAYPGLQKTQADPRAEPGYSIVMVGKEQTYVRRCRFPLPVQDQD